MALLRHSARARQRAGESDFDYRRRLVAQAESGPGLERLLVAQPDFQVQRTEDEAFLKAQAERRERLRRRRGPRDLGSNVVTSPLGLSGPAAGLLLSLGAGA